MTIGAIGAVVGNGCIYADVSNGGVVAPGNSLGRLFISESYTQTFSGKLQIDLASPTSFDKLGVSGNVTFAGELDVFLADGYVPRGGTYSFDILDWTGTRTGTYSAIHLPTAMARSPGIHPSSTRPASCPSLASPRPMISMATARSTPPTSSCGETAFANFNQ